MRGQDREVLPGRLFGALGVHPGHYRHPQRPHPLLFGLRFGQPTNGPAAGGAQAREQRRVRASGWAAMWVEWRQGLPLEGGVTSKSIVKQKLGMV